MQRPGAVAGVSVGAPRVRRRRPGPRGRRRVQGPGAARGRAAREEARDAQGSVRGDEERGDGAVPVRDALQRARVRVVLAREARARAPPASERRAVRRPGQDVPRRRRELGLRAHLHRRRQGARPGILHRRGARSHRPGTRGRGGRRGGDPDPDPDADADADPDPGGANEVVPGPRRSRVRRGDAAEGRRDARGRETPSVGAGLANRVPETPPRRAGVRGRLPAAAPLDRPRVWVETDRAREYRRGQRVPPAHDESGARGERRRGALERRPRDPRGADRRVRASAPAALRRAAPAEGGSRLRGSRDRRARVSRNRRVVRRRGDRRRTSARSNRRGARIGGRRGTSRRRRGRGRRRRGTKTKQRAPFPRRRGSRGRD